MWILPGEERTRGQHDARRVERQTHLRDDAGHAVAGQRQIVDGLLENRKVRLRFQPSTDRRLIERAIGLATRRAHRRTFRRIQRAPLDARAIGGPAHDAAERIDFLDQMPLADAADGRIAAHLPERFDVVRQQQRARTEPRRRERSLGAGMAATDDDHIKMERKKRPSRSLEQARIIRRAG